MRSPGALTAVVMASMVGLSAAARTTVAAANEQTPAVPSQYRLAQQDHRRCDPNCPSVGAGRVQPGSPAHFIRSFDENGDGKVSREEFRGPPQRFDIMDSDEDGFVTREEFAAAAARRAGGGSRPPPARANAPEMAIIATHTHLQPATARGADWASATRNALARMDELGIRTAVIMPTPRPGERSDDRFIDGLLAAAGQHPDRFVVAGGGASLNGMIQSTPPDRVSDTVRNRFAARAEELVRKGVVAFGEMTALHFSLFDGHPFEESRPDHPLFLLLADIAAAHDVPIDFHMEAVTQAWRVSDLLHRQGPNNPGRVAENIAAFERLLAYNRRARIIWVHLGMDATGHRSVALTRRLLGENPNLYISITSHQNSVSDERFFEPKSGLHPAWRDLIVEFSDRFMIGTDTFFLADDPILQMPDRTPMALASVRRPDLPPAVARKVAFENAQRLFKLKPPAASPVAPASTPPPAISTPHVLTEAEIRQTVIGNTLNFRTPRDGRNLYVFFAPDGNAAIKAAGETGGAVVKRWFINDKGMLCRTVGPSDRQHCTTVQATGAPDTLTLLNPRFQYRAIVIAGRRLPE